MNGLLLGQHSAWSPFLVWSYLRLTRNWRRGHGAAGGCGEEEEGSRRVAETEILLLPWLPHTLASPGSPQAWHLPSALRFWVRALGLVASDAGRPWSLLIKMHHPHNTVMELEGGSSLRRAAVKAAQTTCVFFHCDSA